MGILLPVPEPHRTRLAVTADWLAVAAIAALPWSTSALAILVVIWALVLLPTLERSEVTAVLRTPAGALPIVLVVLAVAGLAWSQAPWADEFRALQQFFKLLAIPLLMIQFRRSGNGMPILIAFIASCTVLLALSYAHATFPFDLPFGRKDTRGAPIFDYIIQSGFFTLAAFLLIEMAGETWRADRRIPAMLLALLAAVFLLNLAVVVTGRTSLVVAAVLAAVFVLRAASLRMTAIIGGGVVALAVLAVVAIPQLRERVLSVQDEVQRYDSTGELNSSGQRLTYWRISLMALRESPVIGLGTGATGPWFNKTVEQLGLGERALVRNPHNQILGVGVQLGLIGIVVLLAMWLAHGMMFRGIGLADTGLVVWAGLAAVVQNVVASLFNSHLFDFAPGWLYVFIVGSMAGVMVHNKSKAPDSA